MKIFLYNFKLGFYWLFNRPMYIYLKLKDTEIGQKLSEALKNISVQMGISLEQAEKNYIDFAKAWNKSACSLKDIERILKYET